MFTLSNKQKKKRLFKEMFATVSSNPFTMHSLLNDELISEGWLIGRIGTIIAPLRIHGKIVFYGMPGGGKSSIAFMTSRELKMPFFDIDEVLKERDLPDDIPFSMVTSAATEEDLSKLESVTNLIVVLPSIDLFIGNTIRRSAESILMNGMQYVDIPTKEDLIKEYNHKIFDSFALMEKWSKEHPRCRVYCVYMEFDEQLNKLGSAFFSFLN